MNDINNTNTLGVQQTPYELLNNNEDDDVTPQHWELNMAHG